MCLSTSEPSVKHQRQLGREELSSFHSPSPSGQHTHRNGRPAGGLQGCVPGPSTRWRAVLSGRTSSENGRLPPNIPTEVPSPRQQLPPDLFLSRRAGHGCRRPLQAGNGAAAHLLAPGAGGPAEKFLSFLLKLQGRGSEPASPESSQTWPQLQRGDPGAGPCGRTAGQPRAAGGCRQQARARAAGKGNVPLSLSHSHLLPERPRHRGLGSDPGGRMSGSGPAGEASCVWPVSLGPGAPANLSTARDAL